MFDKLLNEKNRYILFNLLFSLILIGVFLLLIAILKDSALYVISTFFKEIFSNALLGILAIFITCSFIGYIIYSTLNHKVIIKGSIVYLTSLINLVQLFNLDIIKLYFSKVIDIDVLFIKKFIFIFLYIILIIGTVYSIKIIINYIWKIIYKKLAEYNEPRILSNEIKQAAGIYYLDFDYKNGLSYYVTYKGNNKVIKEELKSNRLLCLVGELLVDEDYEIKLYSKGKLKAKFVAIESKETVKFRLNRKPTELQERIAEYYHYSYELIDTYIALLGVFDKMFKRTLIHSPEVIIIESLNKKDPLAKICLEKENIVLRFNYNPFLLEEEFDIINSFEEDCMFPTKYIVRNINDVEYVKKIVNRIKK